MQFLMQAFKFFKNRNDMFENSFKIQVQYFTQKFHPEISSQEFDPDILNINFDELFLLQLMWMYSVYMQFRDP